MSAFVAASVVLVGLLFVAALSISGAQDRTVSRIRAQAPTVKRWGGWILVAVGVWFLALAVFADRFADLFPV